MSITPVPAPWSSPRLPVGTAPHGRLRWPLGWLAVAPVLILAGCGEVRNDGGDPLHPAAVPASPPAQFLDLALPAAPWSAAASRSWTSGAGRELDAVYAGGTDLEGLVAALVESNRASGWVVVPAEGVVVLQRGEEELRLEPLPGSTPRLHVTVGVRP